GCSDSGANSKTTTAKEENFTLVEVRELIAEPYVDYVSLIGVVKPYQIANISSLEGGKIKQFNKSKGSFVKEGEIILTIDNDILNATLGAVKAQYDLAEMNFTKQEKIYKENVSSEMVYLQSKYQRDAARANYELIKVRYEQTFIKAPFSGYLDSKFFEEGEVVSPGLPIITLINSNTVKVTAGLPENFIAEIKAGNECIVNFKDLNDLKVKSRISFMGKSITTNNRTLPIEMLVPNSNNQIKPELNAEVQIQRGKYDKMIVIPENVVSRTDYGYIAFVVNGEKAELRKIKILNRRNNQVAVSEGLKEGEKLIVVGYQSLVNGENIKVMR
ncbi:MAG: efflux RND transporter periplasmic adaptor subunit, partial [Ignavibacteriaceae bacterium]|nr:efflux RND transporter periplasmic adaptor subunit [Ignavibacteriaceae bacterium]